MILLVTQCLTKVSTNQNLTLLYLDLEMFLDDGENLDDGDIYPQTDMNNDEFQTDGDQPQRGAVTR